MEADISNKSLIRPLFKSNSDPNTGSLIEKYNKTKTDLFLAYSEIDNLKTRSFFANSAAHFKEKQLNSARSEILQLFSENERLGRDYDNMNKAMIILQKNNVSLLGRIKDVCEENESLHDEIRRINQSEKTTLKYKFLIDNSFEILTEIALILGTNPLDIPSGPEFILNQSSMKNDDKNNKYKRKSSISKEEMTMEEIKEQFCRIQKLIIGRILQTKSDNDSSSNDTLSDHSKSEFIVKPKDTSRAELDDFTAKPEDSKVVATTQKKDKIKDKIKDKLSKIFS
jgi:hypothetical protein